MARVFISHSSRDDEAARWLADWLSQNGFEAPFLDFDKHSGIAPGADWERTLYQAIATSQAMLIVQSDNWNDSKWCFAEFTQARALGKPIIQLVGVPPTAPQPDATALAPVSRDLQQLDLQRDSAEGLQALARELTAIALEDRGGFPWDANRSPYPGLLCFDQDDAAIYFGRDQEIRGLIEQLQALRIQGGQRLVVLLGASGAGKSSLLRAGVLPRLARSGGHWLPLPPIRAQGNPCAALAQTLSLALGGTPPWRDLDQELRDAAGNGRLAARFRDLAADLRLAQQRAEAELLISVDQAEEIFTSCDPTEAALFFSLLSTALSAEAGFQILMTLRSDFLGSLQSAPGLAVPLLEVSLPPLPIDRIADVIQGPVQVAGLTVEEGFVQAAIRDAHTDDALPLLAFALREIYNQKGNDGMLSLADYQALGDDAVQISPLENAVRRAADGVISIHRPTDEEITALRDAFVPSLVRINDQDDYTRRPARWDSLPPAAGPLLTRLIDARLLTARQNGNERWVEVAHEALLRTWPLLRNWLDEAREFLMGSQQLEDERQDWQQAAADQKNATLLTGLKLTRAETWLQERGQQLEPELRHFIEASVAHRDRLARQRRRGQTLVVSGLALLALMASGAWLWGQVANRQAHEAQTRQFQSVHLSMLTIDPMQSLVHGLAAMARLRSNLNEVLPLAISLERAASRNRLRGQWPSQQDEVWSLAETPSGRLISGGRDGSLRFWNREGHAEALSIQTLHRRGIRGLVALGEAEWWTAGDDGTLQHWIKGVKRGPAILSGHGSIQALALAMDGTLISAGSDGRLRRWNRVTGKALGPPLATPHLEVWSLAVLPNGDWVSGGREGSVQWWRNGRPRGALLSSGQGAVTALVNLPGNAVLSGGDDGSLKIWRSDGFQGQKFNSGHSSIFALLLRKNGHVLSGGSERLLADGGNTIRAWEFSQHEDSDSLHLGLIESLSIVELCNGDLISGGSDGFLYQWRHGKRLGHPIKTNHKLVYALSLLPSSDLASGGDDGTIQIWRNGQAINHFATGQSGVTSLMSQADGTLLSGGRDGSVKRFSVDGRRLDATPLSTQHGAVYAIARLNNGDLLTGGDDGYLRRWRHGQQLGTAIQTPHTTVVSLVIRKNGDWVSGGSGGDIQLWSGGKPKGDYFQVASGSVWSLIEKQDGTLISANGDGTIFTYPSPEEAVAMACAQLRFAGWKERSLGSVYAEASNYCSNSMKPGPTRSSVESRAEAQR